MKASKVFEEILNVDKKIITLQGGSRASKTYSILQFLVYKMITEDFITISIVRKTLPSLKGSVLRDFIKILSDVGLYDDTCFNKTDLIYSYKNNIVEFFSVDQPEKFRGRKRDYLFMNEANEFTKEDFLQLRLRTTKQIFLDYNPHEEYSYIYEEVLTRDDVFFKIVTYKDNPFLEEGVIKEIERLKGIDENYWRIYGLGERGISETTIFTHWQYYEGDFEKAEGEVLFGLDFGYNDPTALIKVKHSDKIICKELLYKSGLTSDNLIYYMQELVRDNKLKYSDKIICDPARPEMIEALFRAGFNVHPAKKGEGSILRGINYLKLKPLFITKDSVELAKELKSYKWKVDKNNKRLDDPVDLNNHILDSLRYAIEEKSRNKKEMGISKI